MQGYEGGSDRAADDATRSRPPEEGVRRSEHFARSVLDGLSAPGGGTRVMAALATATLP